MKIGFYLQNKGITGVDCSHPLEGNPGIGGTEYLFTAIPYALASSNNNHDHEIMVLTDAPCKLPDNLNAVTIDSDLRQTLAKEKIECLVVRYSPSNYEMVKAQSDDTRIIMWAHNFIPRRELSKLANDSQIVGIICVGEEQLQMYRDHQAFYKSVAIFNGYPVEHFIQNHSVNICPFKERNNEVTFLGNLIEYKGFHLLAKAWKKILAAVPNAHLNVIGGGKLYDRNQKLGKWNIAEESYENEFMPYLLDENGKILPSVTFHGVLGNVKNEILNITKVGVPNPSGVSETFCIAALEMQLCGAIISTINYGGFKDTVYKTGILYDSPESLAESVIAQLSKTSNDYDGVLEFCRRFDFKVVAQDWVKMFDAIQQTGNVKTILKPRATKENRLMEFNRKVKRILPFGRFLPTCMFYNSLINRIRNIGRRI